MSYIRSFFSKLRARSKYLLLGFIAAVIALVAAGSFLVLLIVNDKGSVRCKDVSVEAQGAIKSAGNPQDFENAYKTLETGKKACKQNINILGIGDDSAKEKLSQLEYYHSKATVGYSSGKTAQSKKDAEKGLKISEQIPDDYKANLKNYKEIVQDLQWIKDGVY